MTDLELLEQIDGLIDNYNKLWAQDLKKLYDKYAKKLDTPLWDRKLAKLTKKYSPIFADLLLEREETYSRLAAAGEELFLSEFKPPVLPSDEPEEVLAQQAKLEEHEAKQLKAQKAKRVAQLVKQANERNANLQNEE